MRLLALAAIGILVGTSALGFGQGSIGGSHQYPQFRVFSGLPGGGYGVLPNGRPSIDGAAALATPIGYSLAGHGALSLFNSSGDNNPFHYDSSGATEEGGNGSLAFTVGSSYRGFRGSLGFFVLSRVGDSVFSAQVSAPRTGRLGFAVGVQDIFGGGGASGTGQPNDGDSSQSVYGVGTYDLGGSAYVSAGVGTRRFEKGFVNVSARIAPRLRAMTEHDGFNFNSGLLYGTGPLRALRGKAGEAEATVFLGLVRERYATVGLTISL